MYNDTQTNSIDTWQYGRISFNTSDTYRLYLDGYVGSSEKSFIGIVNLIQIKM